MPQVIYIEHDGTEHAIEVPIGENVMRGALYNGIEGIVGECGGALSCATCHCYVDDAWADQVGTPSSHEEKELLGAAAAEVKPNSRLGCQIHVTGEIDGLELQLAPEA